MSRKALRIGFLHQPVNAVAAAGSGLTWTDLPHAFQHIDLAALSLQASWEAAHRVRSPVGRLRNLWSTSPLRPAQERQHPGALGIGSGAT